MKLSLIAMFLVGCSAHGSGFDDSMNDPMPGSGSGGAPGLGGGNAPPGSTMPTQCAIATLGKPGVLGKSTLFQSWLDAKGNQLAANLGDQVLTASLLAPYRMIVAQNLDGNHAYSPAEVGVMRDWVKAGGGLMTLTGYDDPIEIENSNRLLAPFGIQYDMPAILCGCFHSIPINTFMAHPITQGITRIGFDNGHPIGGTPSTYAREQSYDVLKAADFGAGHVVAWGDEWITYDSEWSQHPDYQVQQFWQNVVDWFQPGAHCMVPTPPK